MTSLPSQDIRFHPAKMEKIIGNPKATAEAVNLVYVNDSQEGIHRERTGKGFRYRYRNKIIRDKTQLERVRALVLPPAWENVWICALANGHLQATGLDARNRKQYRYHTRWNKLRSHTKFYRLVEFGSVLPLIRKQVKKDLARPGIPREKVLATVIALMERTSIRVGNDLYEKIYGSVGLTTMKDKHVKLKGGRIRFSFTGKKGKEHRVTLTSKKLAAIVKQCRDIPGKELFQYYDDDGHKQSIDSGMVNEYIKNIVENDFTTKDFRTWAGTVHSLLAFKDSITPESVAERKKNVVDMVDRVAQHLGNTRTVCRKYYIHPSIIALYESDKLQPYLDKLVNRETGKSRTGLVPEEKMLLHILKKSSRVHKSA